jgi:hypothetical protein
MSATVVVTMGCNERGDDLYNRALPFYARRRPNPTTMRELLRLFGQIALSRKGPQDLPASALLLAVTVASYALVSFCVSSLLPPVESWRSQLFLEIGFSLAWYAVMLRAFGKPERFLQTATAMFGYQLMLTPPWIAVINLSRRFSDDTPWQFPVAVIALALLIWIIRAGSYVLKAALELPMVACVALIFAEILASQLVLIALNPTVAAS